MPTVRRSGRTTQVPETGRALRALLDLLGRRWLLRVIWELRGEPLTFRELQAHCGDISASVLARRVAELRAMGLLEDGTRAVGYRLTPLGLNLLDVLTPLLKWADRWQAAVGRSSSRAQARARSPRAVSRRSARSRPRPGITGVAPPQQR